MTRYSSFETERLVLRPTDEEDASFLVQLMNGPKWLRHVGDAGIKSEEQTRQIVRQKITPQFESRGFACYTLLRKSDGAKLGTCGLCDRPGMQAVDLAFALLPEYEKQGFAFEAAHKLLQIASDVFSLKRLLAYTSPHNEDSIKLLEKLGFGYITMDKIPGFEEDLTCYAWERG